MGQLTVITALLASIWCTSANVNDIGGKWTWWNADSTSSLELDIIQINDSIFGDYCAIAYDGKFIDCWLQDGYETPPLLGALIDGSFSVTYKINYAETDTPAYAKATLEYLSTEDVLKWKLGDSEKVTYCPEEATLKRERKPVHNTH